MKGVAAIDGVVANDERAMPQPGIGRFDFGEPMFGTACLVGVETVQIQNVRGTDGLHDSPLEGDGFELVVRRHESRGFLEHPRHRECF